MSNNVPVEYFRLWDLERDDNYVLSLDETLGYERGEMINCVSYCEGKGKSLHRIVNEKKLFLSHHHIPECFQMHRLKKKKLVAFLKIVQHSEILAAGTTNGRIAMWRMVVQSGSSRGDTKPQWKLQTTTEIGGNVTQLQVMS